MKLWGSPTCLLLTLCLGIGTASPLQTGGHAMSHGVGEAIGQGAKEAVSSGIQDALGQGHGEEGGYALRGARGDAFDHSLGEAARSLGNAGHEVGRQAEDVIRHGIDAAHNSGSWGTSGGHGMFGSQGGVGGHGNPGGQGTPWDTEGNFGTNSLSGSVGQGGDGRSFNYETNAQDAVAQPGYGSVRGNNQNSGCTNPPPSDSHESSSGGSSSGGGSGGHGGHGGHNSNNQGGRGGNSQGGSSHSSSGQDSNGSNGSGSRDIETSNFDEGYSVSRGTSSSSGSRGGSGSRNRPECDNPGDDARSAGGSGNQESKESRESSRLLGGSHDYQEHGSNGNDERNEAVSGLKAMNSGTSSLPFSLDSFWENFKSKTDFINWDVINKGRLPPPSTRALLYFRRLWENFKRKTPFFNWKQIEGSDMSSLQKRAGGADQAEVARQEVSAVTAKNYYNNPQGNPPTYNWQYYAKTTATKGAVTPSSSASRAQPGLLKWFKFW